MKRNRNRREFLKLAGSGAVALAAGPSLAAPTARGLDRLALSESALASATSRQFPFELGLTSITCRVFDLERTLEIATRVALKHITLKDIHLRLDSTPEEIREATARIKAAGLELYAGGVIYMRTESQVHQAFEYAKFAGMRMIIGVPEPGLLPLVERKVREYDIKVAIHNLGPTDKTYPLPDTAYGLIKDLDTRIGLCNDIGHTVRSGLDPAASIERFADRLIDVHLKDVSANTAEGSPLEVGRGVTDIPAVIRSLVKIHYAGVVAFEYEKHPDDTLPGLAESVGYVRGVMAAFGADRNGSGR